MNKKRLVVWVNKTESDSKGKQVFTLVSSESDPDADGTYRFRLHQAHELREQPAVIERTDRKIYGCHLWRLIGE